MGTTTEIGWTNHTWNPWVGCHKISQGCKFCYMFDGMTRYKRNPNTVVRTKTWRDVQKWNQEASQAGKPALVFTCSWSDWFHAAADSWRDEVWDVIRRNGTLIFQILTKRPERIADHLPADWGQG